MSGRPGGCGTGPGMAPASCRSCQLESLRPTCEYKFYVVTMKTFVCRSKLVRQGVQ